MGLRARNRQWGAGVAAGRRPHSLGTRCSCPTATWGRWLQRLLVLSRPAPVFIIEPDQLDLVNVIDKPPALELRRMGSILRQKETFLAQSQWHEASESQALKQSCPKALGKHQGLAEKAKRNSCFLPSM